jgi:peptide/nickel transport system substrate-binding protein
VAYFSRDVDGIDPFGASFDPDAYSVITQIFDSLIHLDLDGNLIPGLAVSWKKISDMEWLFSLRKAVKFHNGEDFDAEAVKFTFDYVLNPQNHTPNNHIFAGLVKEVKIINSNQVMIGLTQPDGMFLNRLCYVMPICPPKYIKKEGIEAFHAHPIGTGPFQFEKWEKGKAITLKANRQYWQMGRPILESVIFRILPEEQWVNALVSNEVDFVPNLSGRQTRILVGNKKANVRILKRLTLLAYLTAINNSGILSNVNLRRALNYALNKEDIIRFSDFGNAKAQASFGREGEFGAARDLKIYPYDPEKAKNLIAEAGYKKGFSLRMIASDTAKSVAEIIRVNFKAVGVKLNIDFVSRNETIRKLTQYKAAHGRIDYDLNLSIVDDPINHFGFLSGALFYSKSPVSLLNLPEFDRKYEQAMVQSDSKKHERQLQDLDRFIHEQALGLFTTQRIMTAAVRREFAVEKLGMNGHLDYQILSEAKYNLTKN